MEKIVIVDNNNYVIRFDTNGELKEGENLAVELVITYMPREKQVLLFNRGEGASDMHNHWALESGKVNNSDYSDPIESLIGQPLPVAAYEKAAVREFKEELNFDVSPGQLHLIDSFHMPAKQIYFRMFGLILEPEDLNKLAPNQSELDKIGKFTLQAFQENKHLGDAIVFRKAEIVNFLQIEFARWM